MACPYRSVTRETEEEEEKVCEMHKPESVYYANYLKLDSLLSLNCPATTDRETGEVAAPDEHLFITVHQVHELWFKQMLFDLRRVTGVFSRPLVADEALNQCVMLVNRCSDIVTGLIQAVEVLMTMTPMDFLEFRDLLVPASGFQSVQFRTLETLLGLRLSSRRYGTQEWLESRLSQDDQTRLHASIDNSVAISELVDSWLCRTPFFVASFDWQQEYKSAVEEMLAADERLIRAGLKDDAGRLEDELRNLDATRLTFETLFDSAKYEELKRRGARRFSQKAFMNATFIFLYKDKPLLQMPYLFLQSLLLLDERLFVWRSRHAELAQRMIGTKIGTGGTAGVDYLNKAAHSNRVFADLKNISTFLLPKRAMPKLPSQLETILTFNYSHHFD